MQYDIVILDDKRLYPTAFNIISGTNKIDKAVYTMENYIVNEIDLSKYDWYAHLIGVNGIDEVKLTREVVDGKLVITFDLNNYITDIGNTLTYQIVAKDTKSAVWYSAKGVILNSESIQADEFVAAEYPSILRQWENRITDLAGSFDRAIYYIQHNEDLPVEDRIDGRLYYKFLYAETSDGQFEDHLGNVLSPELVARNIGVDAFEGITASTVQEALEALQANIENKDSLPVQSGNAGKILYTDGTSASWEQAPIGMPLLSCCWSDHLLNDASYLRADTFSWHDGDVYVAAYNHLADELDGLTATTETISGTTVTYYKASDGHKICLADQEGNVGAIYANTGVAWYYIIDTANKRFKLPRTKWGFVGNRGNVGGYVELSASGSDVKATQSYLYFYVGNYVRNLTEIDVGMWSELAHGVDIATTTAEINAVKQEAIAEVQSAGQAIANYQQPLTTITETSGTVALDVNKIYTMSISGNTTFSLPETVNTSYFNQIKVMAKITGTPTIGWGTTYFVNKSAPELEEGVYDFYFDYDNHLAGWVVGAISKGA